MDITLAYNVTDWTAGYFGEIGGFIAYFSAPGQESELRDIKTRVVLSGDQSTRVTLRSLHQLYLKPLLGYTTNLSILCLILVLRSCEERKTHNEVPKVFNKVVVINYCYYQ